MTIATLLVMTLLYISQAWGRRNILDIANAIIAAVLAGYYFKIAGFVIYLGIRNSGNSVGELIISVLISHSFKSSLGEIEPLGGVGFCPVKVVCKFDSCYHFWRYVAQNY